MRIALLIAFGAGVALAAQTPGFRIVVIQGEDAVNIIQQKTAVNPIVEVRDRNDVPVAGVTVIFTIGGQGATFAGGATMLTATTNAVGQAVVTGLTPTATGAVTISANAVVQGQVLAATITQTNFATQAAAAAAAAGGAGSAPAPATATTGGGGGGISGTTIGIFGGVLGAGAIVAATQLGGGEEAPPAPPPPPPCTYALNPSSQSVGDTGGTFSTSLTTTCAWTVTSDSSFLSITSATSGTGSATIGYSVAGNNLNRAPARTGRLTVTGAGGTATLTVSQEAARVAVVTVTVTPNPVPQSGAPVTGAAACAGVRNTWFYDLRIIESGGVAVTLNRFVDIYDGSLANDVPSNTRVNANSSIVFNYRWCHTAATVHTVTTTISGVDANGNSFSVTAPTATLLAPTSGTGGIETMRVPFAAGGGGTPRQ
jgi:hypothetical protein